MVPTMAQFKVDGWRVIKEASYNPFDRTAEGKVDNSACWEIPCRRGGRFDGSVFHFDPSRPRRAVEPVPYKRKAHIYFHGKGTLGFSGCGAKLRRELLAVPGVRKHQTGDVEFSVLFPISAFAAVAAIVKPYRKRGTPLPEAT